MKNSTQTTFFTKILNFFGLAKASELREANNTIEELNEIGRASCRERV